MINPLQESLNDGENNAVVVSHIYRVHGDRFRPAMHEIFQRHGKDIHLLPVSACSAGGGVFQRHAAADRKIIGVHIAAATRVQCAINSCEDITGVALDQIIIDQENSLIYAGAGITLEQLNQALEQTVGEHFKVLGADLTSYTYAQVGSTFMTGGMGPQRRYFSDSVKQVALYDGESITAVEGPQLDALAGTYGWTGMVTAVCCRYYALPMNEIAFAMPVSNTPRALAKLMGHLSSRVFLEIDDGLLKTESGGTDLILGIEHITTRAMGPMLAAATGSAIEHRARQLKQKCNAAGADGLVFINGRANGDTALFLTDLIDDPESDEPSIAGIALEHTEIFNVADEMRAVREAVPAAARGQAPTGPFSFKGHTDANIRLDRKNTGEAMRILWEANHRYVESVERCFAESSEVNGEILVYGHLNPYGVDPHNRITAASDNAAECENVRKQISTYTNRFMRELDQLCRSTDSHFVGGEKGAGSEAEIMEAFASIEDIPDSMKRKLDQQRARIAGTGELFSWRALPPYK